MVGERGFEPPTPWSRTRCSTRLSHSPTALDLHGLATGAARAESSNPNSIASCSRASRLAACWSCAVFPCGLLLSCLTTRAYLVPAGSLVHVVVDLRCASWDGPPAMFVSTSEVSISEVSTTAQSLPPGQCGRRLHYCYNLGRGTESRSNRSFTRWFPGESSSCSPSPLIGC
jgi:hypothetical protein